MPDPSVTEALAAVAIAAAAIFVAEFGDKSQLLVLAFATRYPAMPVVIGLAVATLLVQAASVAVGAAVGAVLPTQVVAVVAGLAFIVVGVWTLRGDDDADDAEAEPDGAAVRHGARAVAAMVATTVVLGELGDKTMLVTFGLAASQGPLPTWIGASLGMMGASLIAVVVGRRIGARLDPDRVRVISGALFVLGGLVVLLGAVAAVA